MSFNFSQDLLSETCPQTQPPPSQPQELEPAAPVSQQHLQEDRVSQDSGYLGSWEAPGARRMAARPPHLAISAQGVPGEGGQMEPS